MSQADIASAHRFPHARLVAAGYNFGLPLRWLARPLRALSVARAKSTPVPRSV